MKYKDSDIILLKTDRLFPFKTLLPSNDYMFLKVLEDNKIIFSSGKLTKKLFRLKNKKLINKDIKDINLEVFNDYILNLKQKVFEDCSAYQFVFQYKDIIDPYVCCIYPCLIYDKCVSFDVVIRNCNERTSHESFFIML
jgi:hypothetical protein